MPRPLLRSVPPGRVAVAAGVLLAAALLAGCSDDDRKVVSYTAPRNDPVERVRLLAAVFAQGDKTWFFKLSGPKDAVTEQKENFEAFVRSVSFVKGGNPPVKWELPQGWQSGPGAGQFQFAVIRIPGKDPLELTVSPLEGEAGTLLGNVNRWRDQIGLRPILVTDLDLFTRDEQLPGGAVTWVDIKGPGKAPKPAAGGGGIEHTKPEGWEPLPPDPKGVYLLGFKAGEGDQSAEVTVTAFPGEAGGLKANVNRWRQQLGMSNVDEDQIRREAATLVIDGENAVYVDLVGPALGARSERILGAIVPKGGRTWFVKMKGPADVVGKQKKAFESFAGSLRLSGGKGDSR